MARQVTLVHRSEYRYDREVQLGPQEVRLCPTAAMRSRVLSYALRVAPEQYEMRWQSDALGNAVARTWVPDRTAVFAVEVELTVELVPVNPFGFALEGGATSYPFVYSEELAQSLEPYLRVVTPEQPLRAWLDEEERGEQATVDFIVGMNQRVAREIAYTTRMEHGVQSPEETLEKRLGSCRDMAWLLVEAFRQCGVAARFVSGYLIQMAAEEEHAAGKPDRVDLHAWAEVYLPGAGWIGLDATSGLLTSEAHIALAVAPTPRQAAPISGTVEPAKVEFRYEMRAERVQQMPAAAPAETPVDSEERDTAEPLGEAAWVEIRALAAQVDRDLEAGDVRLWMGGEPTYVGMDEPESLQWNFEALGADKRARGLALIERLRARVAPQGLLHRGQGKWYPNEPLPRWAFQCFARRDGVAIWEDASLNAQEGGAYGFGAAEARDFAEALARRLGTSPGDLLEAFPPDEARTEPAALALPLRRRERAGELVWSSQLWFPRPARLRLTVGDSPAGYRLPVEEVPWVAPDPLRYPREDGSLAAESKSPVRLPDQPARHPERFGREPAADTLPTVLIDAKDAPVLVRPVLCVEARAGVLYVFFPFVPVLADYLDLVAAVEETAQHLGMPVWAEGYPPPGDPRLQSFGLTPDPGVLEANLPPARDWDEMEAAITLLAEEASAERLRAEKFSFEGGALATGGGSHITLGGPSLDESPLLRRPDLLRSLLTFWQNHPSLSYLFAGVYVGPTSQYPRVDEARTDALYELEVAFSQLREGAAPDDVQGLFRNLLVDVSGNTHRAEFCIDKMYPPEGAGARVGLLELRAFEMPPQPRMDLLQRLLVRALVSAFWRTPFQGELLRWESALHDRFMLPYFVEQDFGQVLEAVAQAGYRFETAWFAAHLHFRFPVLGTLQAEGAVVEVRQALEPWNVLAEETTSSGTGRSVDSSLERLQVTLRAVRNADRYLVTVNGREVPLTAVGEDGTLVAGVRYRARRLQAALHPTIPVHLPLQFALVERASGRVLAQGKLHGGRPDGSLYSALPANAAEARQRREERWVVSPPDRQPVKVGPVERNPVYPMTLDLRWPAKVPGVERA